MKNNWRNTTIYFAALLLLTAGMSSCSKKCKNEQPRSRIDNNGTQKVNVQIQTTGGNTVNINDILPGQISAWASYAPGYVVYTVAFQSGTPDTVIGVAMTNCWQYDITIDAANHVSSVPADRN